MEKKHYFDDPSEQRPFSGVHFDVAGNIALRLIDHFGVIAAGPNGEDTAGRQKLELQAPGTVVKRAFDIAEAFVEEAGKRGCMRESEPIEHRMVRAGELEHLKHQNSYRMDSNPPRTLEEVRARLREKKEDVEHTKDHAKKDQHETVAR